MATFFTKIVLDEVSFKEDEERFEGRFTLDIEELNISRDFTFIFDRPDSNNCVVIINKCDKPFLVHKGRISNGNLKKHTMEERLILMSFNIIFMAYKNRLDPDRFALTRIDRGQRISVTTSTPDYFRNHFTRACL